MSISKSLVLPDGYQHWDHDWRDGVRVNTVKGLVEDLTISDSDVYIYTQHQIFYEDNVLKQTRSSPNWEGGVVTFATCKHQMRSWQRESWQGVWIIGLCPASLGNCLLFAGRVYLQLLSNAHLANHLFEDDLEAYEAKQAMTNPRGDLYERKRILKEADWYDHRNFREPPNHTRSVEFYKRSPGSVSLRPDGKVPKWWRDIEYLTPAGIRPPCFVLSPCWLFSRPLLYTDRKPGRAVLRGTGAATAATLHAR